MVLYECFCFCRRAREDLRVANQRINTILADYGDVVPRREYEMLETSFKVLNYKGNIYKDLPLSNIIQSMYTNNNC